MHGLQSATQLKPGLISWGVRGEGGEEGLVCSILSLRRTFPPFLGKYEDWELSVPPQLKVAEKGKQAPYLHR